MMYFMLGFEKYPTQFDKNNSHFSVNLAPLAIWTNGWLK